VKKNKNTRTTHRQRVIGIIQITRKGVGYVPWQEGLGKDTSDIEVGPEDLRGALNGDEVEVDVRGMTLPRGRHILSSSLRPRGSVVRVISRAREEFVATYTQNAGRAVALPDDNRFYRPIMLRDIPVALRQGDKILVRLISFMGKKDPEGEVIRVLGVAGEHRTEMNAIILEHGFATEFPPEVLQEAKEIEEEHTETIHKEAPTREDFRNKTTFTIDPPDAKDFDDAISLDILADGEYEVGVHIADVSFFVTEKTALEEEAQKRGTSVYLVDSTIPMLPLPLSGNVCSLKENEDRLAFSAVFRMSANGEVRERKFARSIIRSDKRFTYEEAQKVLDSGAGPFMNELSILKSIADTLREKREKEGAIDFGDNEFRFTLDEKGAPVAVFRKERLPTNLLIEEFMLLANREVASFVSRIAKDVPEKNLVFLYRIHDEPKEDRIEELAVFVRALGYEFGRMGHSAGKSDKKIKRYTARDIRKLLADIKGTPEEELIRTATLRSMAKAIYSTKNIGHFGLSFEYYTHFTSPIRRYPDLLVHRILASHLSGSPITRREFGHLERLCIAASEQEAKAADAERDSVRYKQVEFMTKKIGEEFSGTISGVTDWGFYVEEDGSGAEGLVRLQSLKDDYYAHSPKSYSIVGQRTKKKLALGDRVRVRLAAADISARTLDFELIALDEGQAAAARK